MNINSPLNDLFCLNDSHYKIAGEEVFDKVCCPPFRTLALVAAEATIIIKKTGKIFILASKKLVDILAQKKSKIVNIKYISERLK